MNPKYTAMKCPRCHKTWEIADYIWGCPDCYKRGTPTAMVFVNNIEWEPDESGKGMMRYGKMLPYGKFIQLGEGGTPLVELQKLAAKMGLEHLYSKNEFQNPTGSHKDRMNPLMIARVKELGCPVVAAASSGNEGVSLACYAAAGIRCVIATSKNINFQWRRAIEAAGAELVIMQTSEERGEYIQKRVIEENWYSATNLKNPPVGSSTFGIQGYKTIAYELYEEMKDIFPDYILVPVSRGDLLWGIYEGFADLLKFDKIKKLPHLVAVEPFARLELTDSLEDCTKIYPGDSHLTPSIGGGTVTVQSKLALEATKGFAVSADMQQVDRSVRMMAVQGLYLENSSALVYACLEKAVRTGQIENGANVVLIATSHGFKNA